MSYKQVLFESAAREKLLRGVTALTDAVRVTLGPDREKLQERLAKLSGGVAVIKAGAPTEAELESIRLGKARVPIPRRTR